MDIPRTRELLTQKKESKEKAKSKEDMTNRHYNQTESPNTVGEVERLKSSTVHLVLAGSYSLLRVLTGGSSTSDDKQTYRGKIQACTQ